MKILDIKGNDITGCWESLEKMKWNIVEGKKLPVGYFATQWIHLQDALIERTVTKSDCYDSIKLGYCMESLKVRKSRYSHLL